MLQMRKTAGVVQRKPASGLRAASAPLRRARSVAVSAAAAAASAGGGANDDVKGAMLDPSPANNPAVRLLTVGAAVAAVSGGATVMTNQAAAFLHLVAYGTLLGAMVFNTFVVGLTMFRNMPRQMFGRVQSKMFPQYFGLTTGCIGVMLVQHYLSPSGLAMAAPGVKALVVAGALSLLNWLAIEPYVTSQMFERYALENKPNKGPEDEAAIKALYKKFGAWHGISSLNNLGVLASTVAYAWIVASKLAAPL